MTISTSDIQQRPPWRVSLHQFQPIAIDRRPPLALLFDSRQCARLLLNPEIRGIEPIQIVGIRHRLKMRITARLAINHPQVVALSDGGANVLILHLAILATHTPRRLWVTETTPCRDRKSV